MIKQEILGSAHRQMAAVVAKTMESLESMAFMRDLHPLEFDQVRTIVFRKLWDAYNTGLSAGKRIGYAEVHETES